MTTLLMRAIWFPADSQLDVVSPGAVFRLIAARGEASHLDIYENRRVVGKLNITPASPQLPGDTQEIRIHLDGNLELRLVAQRLSINGNFVLSHEGDLVGMDFKLEVKAQKLKLTLNQPSREQAPVMKLTLGGLLLLDTSQTVKNEAGIESNPSVALLLGLIGMSSADFDAMRRQAHVEAASTVVDARQGEFELNGSKHRGYILSLRKQGNASFRLCVENTGRIVSIETPTSYQLLSDELNENPP